MRYFAVIFLIVFSLGMLSGCGKPPDSGVDYNKMRNTEKPEKKEPPEGSEEVF